jgi:hypothetical protein
MTKQALAAVAAHRLGYAIVCATKPYLAVDERCGRNALP